MKQTNPALHIRCRVFGVATQREFADLLGYEQPTISRWENGDTFSSEAQKRIRKLASDRRIAWDNNWFFEVPAGVKSAA